MLVVVRQTAHLVVLNSKGRDDGVYAQGAAGDGALWIWECHMDHPRLVLTQFVCAAQQLHGVAHNHKAQLQGSAQS